MERSRESSREETCVGDGGERKGSFDKYNLDILTVRISLYSPKISPSNT